MKLKRFPICRFWDSALQIRKRVFATAAVADKDASYFCCICLTDINVGEPVVVMPCGIHRSHAPANQDHDGQNCGGYGIRVIRECGLCRAQR